MMVSSTLAPGQEQLLALVGRQAVSCRRGPGPQRSSLLPAARLERRRRQQASLKEKEMIVSPFSLAGRRAPAPGPEPV